MYIVEVTKWPLAGTPRQLPHCHGSLSTHGPLGDILPLLAEAVIYGVVVTIKPAHLGNLSLHICLVIVQPPLCYHLRRNVRNP